MQKQQSCALQREDDPELTSIGCSWGFGGLLPVPIEALPAPTIYTRFGKRTFDSIAAIMILLVLALPMLLMVGAIHFTSPGGPFYSQVRVGRYRSTFRCLKFRSMVKDADNLLLENPQLKDAMAVSWKLTDDPRVTPIGRRLRAHSLDEFAQLFNVLKGHMSLVGPRPYMPHELEGEFGRHAVTITSVRPGMTGLWQVSGRSNLAPIDRIALDECYVQHVTFRGDLSLLCRTVKIVLNRHGAY